MLKQIDFTGFNEPTNLSVAGQGYDMTFQLKALIAKSQIQTDIWANNTFIYLYRRFGTPILGCPKTDLGRYIFPTKSKNVALCFEIGADLCVYPIVDKPVALAYWEWFYRPLKEWSLTFEQWFFDEKGVLYYDSELLDIPENERGVYQEMYQCDMKKHQEQAEIIDFWEWKKAQINAFKDAYAEIQPYPIPSGAFTEVYSWYKNLHQTNELANEIYEAIQELLDDLAKPVLIGEVYYNLFGQIPQTGQNKEEAEGRVWKHAGNGFMEGYVENYDKWIDLCISAKERGTGDMQAGFEALITPPKVRRFSRNGKKMRIS